MTTAVSSEAPTSSLWCVVVVVVAVVVVVVVVQVSNSVRYGAACGEKPAEKLVTPVTGQMTVAARGRERVWLIRNHAKFTKGNSAESMAQWAWLSQ